MSTEPSPLPASSTPTAVTDTGDRTGPQPAADQRDDAANGLSDGSPDRTAGRTPDRPAETGPRSVEPARPAADPSARADESSDRSAGASSAAAPMAGRRQDSRQAAGSRAGARGRRPPSRGKRKVRKVHRVVRHIEVWSLAKLTAIFVACGYVVAMVAGYLLWRAADRVGTIDGIEGFMEDSGGYDTFVILGDVVFRAAAVIGLVLAVVNIAVVVLGAVLFNLISDLTGGIRMTVIDEDLIVAPARRPPSGSPSSPPASGSGPSGSGRGDGPPSR